MKNFILLFLFYLCLGVTQNISAIAGEEEAKTQQPPQITNEKLREYKNFIEKKNKKEKEIPEIKNEISSHEKDPNYKENVQRALKEKTNSINGYRVRPNCGQKNDIKILLNYSVIYDTEPSKEYIYSVAGKLYQIAYIYPEYKAVYSNLGKLTQIIFPLDEKYFCIFSGKGALYGIVDTEGNLYNRSGTMQE